MKKAAVLIFILFISLTSYCQKEVNLRDAHLHVGEIVKLCTTITGGKFIRQLQGSPTFFDAGSAYPAPVSIVIWYNSRKNFKSPPEMFYKNKSVCVTGKISLVNKQIFLEVSKPEEIQLNTTN